MIFTGVLAKYSFFRWPVPRENLDLIFNSLQLLRSATAAGQTAGAIQGCGFSYGQGKQNDPQHKGKFPLYAGQLLLP